MTMTASTDLGRNDSTSPCSFFVAPANYVCDPDLARGNRNSHSKVLNTATKITKAHHYKLVGKQADRISPSQLKETIRTNKTNQHKKVESFEKTVAANIPGVSIHGNNIP